MSYFVTIKQLFSTKFNKLSNIIIHTSLVKNDVIENVWPSKCVLFVYAYMHYLEKHRTAVSEVTCLNLRSDEDFNFVLCLILILKPLYFISSFKRYPFSF